MDVLGDILLTTRLLASTGGLVDLAVPWGVTHPDEPSNQSIGMTLIEGPCWFQSETVPLVEMQPGDSILTLRGRGHRIMSSPDAKTVAFDDFLSAQGIPVMTVDHPQETPSLIRMGTGDVRTRFIVFGLIAEDAGPSSLISNLRPTLYVKAGPEGLSSWTAAAASFFARDSHAKPGYLATATRLVELLFTEIVRQHILAAPAIDAGWMRGLRDPRIGRAITCIHSRPGEAWTVERLAREAGMGRSTFARRFSQLLGMSPMEYLTDHRMSLACLRLSVDRQAVGRVAEALGYRSERAFRQAFRSRYSVAPSKYFRTLAAEQ